jgi:murein DD-endopeptidase MepM/ murein hydrolase activator NlpD
MSRKKKQTRHHATRSHANNSRRGTLRLGLVIAVLLGINLYVFLWRGETSIPAVMEKAAVAGTETGEDNGLEGPNTADTSALPKRANEPSRPGKVLRGEVGPGDSMGQILRQQGMLPGDADELIRALSGTLDFRKIRAGQKYRLNFDPSGRLSGFEFELSKVSKINVVRDDEGKLKATKLDAKTELRQESLGGEIHGSLYRSMKRAGEDTSLVSFFVDVFAYDLNFYIDTHPGDTYRLLVEKEYFEGEFMGYGHVLAAEYQGSAGTYRAFWWQKPGSEKGKYYDARGQSVEKTFLKTPLKFARVSSGFNPKRMHPVLHVRKGHWGTDYAAPPGTPIWSAAAGRITFRGRRGGAGNCVIVKHENGLQTVYMHMSKFKSGQRVGARVRAKDVIGYVGSTGLATGPHLHFGVKKNGRYIDPQKMKMTRGSGVSRKDMAQFKSDTEARVAALATIGTEPAPANPFLVQLTI